MKILHDGKAVIVGLETINLDDFPNLKVIGCNMTGIEHLPLEECEKRGIKVISLKGETDFLREITSTAEHTIGLIIALLRNYKTAFNAPYKDREFYKGYTLKGKKLFILGYGRVGKQIKKMGQTFGMKVASKDKWGEPTYNTYSYNKQELKNMEDWVLLDTLRQSDIVSLHIPLQDNEGFFTKEMFKSMKPTAYLVNTSRSGVIENGALLWALSNNAIAGAAVDFIDDPALVEYAKNCNNLILTNHIGGCTFEDMEKTENFITKKVEDYMKKYGI